MEHPVKKQQKLKKLKLRRRMRLSSISKNDDPSSKVDIITYKEDNNSKSPEFKQTAEFNTFLTSFCTQNQGKLLGHPL